MAALALFGFPLMVSGADGLFVVVCLVSGLPTGS